MIIVCRRVLVTAAALTIAGCSGGGTGHDALALPVTASPTAQVPSAPMQSARLTIRFPARASTSFRRRQPHFVSPATRGLEVDVYASPRSANATPLNTIDADVSPSSTSCAADPGGTRTCTIALPITAGTYDFTFALYDATAVRASFAAAHLLGTGAVTKTIVRNADNVVSVSVDGQIASLALTPLRQTFLVDQPATLELGVTPLDADLATILAGPSDPYANPLSVAVADSGGHTLLSLNGGAPAASVTSTQLSDRIEAIYDGKAAPGYSASVSVAATGASSASGTLDAFAIAPKEIDFTAFGATATIAVTEPHATGPFSLAPSLCTNVATTSAGQPSTGDTQTFTITAASTNGSCNFVAANETTSPTSHTFVNLYVPGPPPVNRLFAASGDSNYFQEFDLANAGAPVANIGSDFYSNRTTLVEPAGIARDAAGQIYVADLRAQSIDVFTPTVNDNMAPVAAVTGPLTQLALPRTVRIDASGNIVALNTASITIYPPGSSGNVAPSRSISLSALPADTFRGLAVDRSGNFYLVGTSSSTGTSYLFELAASANGSAAALRTVTGPSTGISRPNGVAVDTNGNAYVTSPGYGDWVEFAPTQNGDAPAIFTSATNLVQPGPIVVGPDGTVIVASQVGLNALILTYPAGASNYASSFGGSAGDLSL